ncbi:hypothetical protein [Halosimplex salinum]|uniref:hypothetical protein n=1 Tax=Halosimplex salinum TaxID=1710538 RepID=UPI0019D2AB28|nr:hypothetical protein [Halosimplex salinum]
MELQETLGDRDRTVRTLLTAALAAVAIRSFRKGNRLRGLLVGGLAAVTGYSVATASAGEPETVDTERPRERGELRCAACGEPIVPGQVRKPNENDETVHEACLEKPA